MKLDDIKKLCKEKGIRVTGKKKAELLNLLKASTLPSTPPSTPSTTIQHVSPTIVSTTKQALSLFSGAGGDTCGLEAAGWHVSHFSEFNAAAIQTHKAVFSSSELLVGPENSTDIKKVPDGTFEALKGQVDLIFAGFPCFVKDTPVLTQKGYMPIQDVSLEDTLMTHTGVFRNIINLQKKSYTGSLYSIHAKYHPEPIVCTEEHPFYVREKKRTWNNEYRKYEYSYGEPQWKTASELTANDYFGMTVNKNSIIPTMSLKKKINKSRTDTIIKSLDNIDEWFMMGYFIGDGWIEETKKASEKLANKIRFVFHEKDTDIIERIQRVLPITNKNSDSGRSVKFGCSDFVWFTILKDFGKYAHQKKIPEWVQDAPVEYIRAFVDGYMAADGYIRKNESHRVTTVSFNLAYGLQRLYLKLGHIASVEKTVRPKHCMIMGRTCNQRDTYQVSVQLTLKRKMSSFIDNDYVWFATRTITSHTVQDESVYNFEVDMDNSYIVHNTIVHNCQGFSHAGKKRVDDPRNELVHEFVRATKLIQPTWIVGENVRGLLSRKGVYPANTTPRPVIEIIRELFDNIGYKITYRVFDAVEVGVPQKRKRLLIVGHKGTEYPHLPWETVFVKTTPTIRSILTSTLQGAVEVPSLYKPQDQPERFWIRTTETFPTGTPHPNLVRLVNGIRNLSSKEKEAQGIKETTQYVEPNGLLSFGVRKGGYHGEVMDPDAPAKTIICAYNQCPRLFVGLYNPEVNKYWVRCLTVTECGQIQGFPVDYSWKGSDKEKIVQIGNAVPPPLATAIATLIERVTFHTIPQGTEEVTGGDSEEEE